MIRDTPSYSLDSGVQIKFQQKLICKPMFYIKSLVKKRKTRPKSQEATDSDQQNMSLVHGPSRRKSCYCNECGSMGKKQLQFMDLKLSKQPKALNKRAQCNIDRRCTLNIQSISTMNSIFKDRSVFYRRNTQKNSEKVENQKSPTCDLGDSKSPGWFIRQMVMRKSIINVQKLMENSHSKHSYQLSHKKILGEDLLNPKSQQTIHVPNSIRTIYQKSYIDSPGARIKTVPGFDCENNLTSPRNIPKLSPYLSFRQINFNLLVPLKLKSNSSARKTNKKIFSHSKAQN
ncbi:unnamed protein product (macronuclear) [Paramecium tetraurelia]|uniref:Uncharacterized protein n=1 Tax=Paramecium tetraurelia TaxID=5888 RepID=A0C6H5_PARTE|nr:uncharacterized protein GSPATT00035521001 [Paramecium tetraurelia]CAK66392.1 unnamed protein product [Paramecium tetraurelia]|eukprot:XP_001433789.1 hypothetical protein (macronuclear) [Paramecium tetraurelia strain d4-2]